MDKQAKCVSPSPSSALALILIAHNKVQHSDLYKILLSKVALIAFWAYFFNNNARLACCCIYINPFKYISTPSSVLTENRGEQL